jgi:predicted cupin superfamily sugar epimerase
MEQSYLPLSGIMDPKIKALIDYFHFTPLPAEGTLFASTWRSSQEFPDGSPVGTAMIGMYCNDPLSQSSFHRLPVDETWHFYGGDPLRLVLLSQDGSSQEVMLGSDVFKGEQIQFTVKAGIWQAGQIIEGGSYSLFGCTLAPGFTGLMYEGGLREILLKNYPDRKVDILRLTLNNAETRMPEGFAK